MPDPDCGLPVVLSEDTYLGRTQAKRTFTDSVCDTTSRLVWQGAEHADASITFDRNCLKAVSWVVLRNSHNGDWGDRYKTSFTLSSARHI